MVDNSCIIEGNVKFRDGKKVSGARGGCERICRARIRPDTNPYSRLSIAFSAPRLPPSPSPFLPCSSRGLALHFFLCHPVDSRQSRERIPRVNSPIIRDARPRRVARGGGALRRRGVGSGRVRRGGWGGACSPCTRIRETCAGRAMLIDESPVHTTRLTRDKNYVTITGAVCLSACVCVLCATRRRLVKFSRYVCIGCPRKNVRRPRDWGLSHLISDS